MAESHTRNSALIFILLKKSLADNNNQETFFYDFCILQYGVVFSYEEELYEAEFTDDGPVLTNRMTNEVQGPFEDAVNLIENACVKNKKLITILDDLKNIVLH